MKVLVVDDDVVSRMVLMHLVDACGQFDILEAEDGEDAWQQLSASACVRPSVFCDLRMPRLSGMDLLARVRADAALAAMPFVLVTSANDTATVDRANGLGADGYLVKPFDAAAVSECIAPLLAAASESSGEGAAPGSPDAVADTLTDAVPDAVADAETPLATMGRLGIDGERLLVYLGGFQTQLAAASTDLAALLASGDTEAAHVRLDRLHARLPDPGPEWRGERHPRPVRWRA
ncbi:response regulator [Massilia sp. H-1]|nr:response regulator [Massilia sp. H-1]